MLRDVIFKEIIREINSKSFSSYRLYGKITYGDLIKDTKQLEMTDDIIHQLFDFDLKVDIDFSFLDGEKPKKEIIAIDDDINQILQNVTTICDNEHIRLDNFRTALIDDDYVSKKIKEMTENHISTLTYNNNTDIDFTELNMLNDSYSHMITHRDEEQKDNESKRENEEEKKTPLEYLTSLEELNDTNENDDINIYNEGKYPLKDFWDSNEIYVDIVDKSSMKGFQEKFANTNEEMNLFIYHNQRNKKENDIIYTGSALGKIRKYGLSGQTYILNLENAKKFESPVLCFDVKQNMKSNKIILIAGFENGHIVVYEEDKEVDRNKEIFKDIPIISIKIIKITDKINEFIVSDNKANVFIIRRENSFFTWKFKQERIDLSILNIKLPIYTIDYYNIDTNEDISNQNEQNLIFIFLSANQINVLKIKPEISNLLTISTSIENVNDFSFAKANLPSKTLSSLLLISCNSIITLYDLCDGKSIKEIGTYEHTSPINKIGFVSCDFIYLIDNEKIKIVSLYDLYYKKEKREKRVEIKEIYLNEDSNITMNNTTNINTSNQNNDIEDVFSSVFANREIYKDIPAKNIRNRIFTANNRLYIFGKKKIKEYKLKHWTDVLNKMEEKQEWEKILCLGLDVLQYNKDKNLLFPLDNENFEKNKKNEFSSLLLRAYNNIKLGYTTSPKDIAIKMLIEFCIKVNIIDALFGDFFYQFIIENNGKLFFESLEQFITLNEFKPYDTIPEHFFTELIKFYFSYSTKMYLSKLLLHFNISALSNKSITEIIINNDLINTYIYISMNNPDEENYYRPYELMLNYFNSKKDNVNYGTFITMHDKQLYNDDMLSSRQYFGHKLLWYSQMCLNGVKYPDNVKMEPKAYDDIVRKTILFLIANIEQFLNFDSFSFFSIIKRYYIEDDLYEKICRFSYKKYEDFIEILNLTFKEKKINQDIIVDILCDKSINVVDNFYILKDLYDFLSDACKTRPELQISHEIAINGIQYYVKYMTAKLEHPEDPFSCHHQNISNFVKENKKIEEKIIELLEYLQPTIRQEEIDRLQSIYELSSFKAAKVFFLNLMGSYKESFELQLETLLQEKGTEDSHKNIKHFFKWINETLQKLNDKEDFNGLRSVILDKLSKLSELSLGDVTTLVNTWFSDQIIDVITKLGSSPSLQLKYLMNIKNKFEKMEMEDDTMSMSDTDSTIYTKSTFERQSISIKRDGDNESEFSMTSSENSYLSRLSSISSLSFFNRQLDEENDRSTASSSTIKKDNFDSNNIPFFEINPEDQKKEIQNQLDIMEIKLLCENHRKDDIFSIVSNNISICTNDLLELLIKNRVYDSVIYIYKVMGLYQQGIDLTKISIEKNYNKMLKNLSNENFKEKINKLLLNRHDLYLNLGLSICQLASENEDMLDSWVSLLEMLYKIKANIQSYVQQNTNNDKTYFYSKIRDSISESIEVTLEKMCEYVTLPLILEIVTEKIKGVIIGFKEFKKLLMRMLHSLSQMEIILTFVKKMLLKSVHQLFYKFKDVKLKGYCIKLEKCNYCKKKFENEQKCITISFECGHSYHKKCCGKENNEYVCFICRKEEIEMSAMRIKNKITVSQEVKATENKISVTQSDEEKIKKTENEIKEERKKEMKKKLHNKNKKYLNFILLVDKAAN